MSPPTRDDKVTEVILQTETECGTPRAEERLLLGRRGRGITSTSSHPVVYL